MYAFIRKVMILISITVIGAASVILFSTFSGNFTPQNKKIVVLADAETVIEDNAVAEGEIIAEAEAIVEDRSVVEVHEGDSSINVVHPVGESVSFEDQRTKIARAQKRVLRSARLAAEVRWISESKRLAAKYDGIKLGDVVAFRTPRGEFKGRLTTITPTHVTIGMKSVYRGDIPVISSRISSGNLEQYLRRKRISFLKKSRKLALEEFKASQRYKKEFAIFMDIQK